MEQNMRAHCAVTDSSGGVEVVRAPSDRNSAIRLRERHNNQFWCTTKAEGCGGSLELAAGTVVAPYFRHRRGATECSLLTHPEREEKTHEHLWYQRVLVAWLAGQGHTSEIEYYLGQDGRSDLHVNVLDVDHSIEVQLSPITRESWRERDTRYRNRMDHVTWLYGAHAEGAAARAQTMEGLALRLRGNETPEIGTSGHNGEHWATPGDCTFGKEGFWTPHLADALAAKTEADAEAVRKREESDRLREQRKRRARYGGYTQPSALPPVTASPRYPDTLAHWRRDNPSSHSWAPPQGWGWLQALAEPERSTAKFLAWAVQESGTVGGTVEFLTFPDGGDIELVVSALEQVDLIRTYETSGVRRWERHHGRTHGAATQGTDPGPQNRSTR